MQMLQLHEIVIPPNRQRREFDPDALQRLVENIETLGLMHPVVVREGGTLVAGERRLRAIQELWDQGGQLFFEGAALDPGFIPCVNMGELDEIQAMEAELSENIIRADLTWQERAEALAALQKLRLALNPDHTVADLAQEVTGQRHGSYQVTTRRALIVADHLDNPAIASAKNVDEAYKLLKRQESSIDFANRAVEVGKTFGAHAHTALQGDCLSWLVDLPAASFDCICTDPPYGMDADSFGNAAGKLTGIDHAYGDSPDEFRSLLSAFIPLCGRVAKPSAALYVCCDLDQFFWLRTGFRAAGWYVFRTPLINVKPGSGRVPLPDHGPRRQYETILFGYRGGRKTNSIQSDVISTRGDEQLGHGAQKPVELFSNLLARSCRPGDSVLDPFSGTGTIFPAAHGLKLRATGIELDAAYYGMGIKRLEALK